MRPDIYALAAHATQAGLNATLHLVSSPLTTSVAVEKLKETGIGRVALDLDGSRARTHDSLGGQDGSFRKTLEIADAVRLAGIPLQIRSNIVRRNVEQVDALADLLEKIGPGLRSICFPVPFGRGRLEPGIKPDEYDLVFERIHRHSLQKPYQIDVSGAPFYCRYLLQQP